MVIVVDRNCLSGCWDNGCQFFVSFIVFCSKQKSQKKLFNFKIKRELAGHVGTCLLSQKDCKGRKIRSPRPALATGHI